MSNGVSTTDINGWKVLAVAGDLDMSSGPALDEAVAAIVPDHLGVVIDLSNVQFVDSSGLGVLVRALKRVRSAGGQLILVIDSPTTRKLFSITGLDLAFEIVTSLADVTATPFSADGLA
jgi:anti-sigma B factor antagonist